MAVGTGRLLGADEPAPVAVEREGGASPILVCCDHAGRRIPVHLGRLGLAETEFDRHIAWDIGALGVARLVSRALDATLVRQRYSRLVVDCNRPPGVAGAIPVVSERTDIPGNIGLGESEREARFAEFFQPYHDRLAAVLDDRERQGRRSVLVAMHSFTPAYLGVARPWHVGTLYGRDDRLARALYREFVREDGLVVGDNEPYAVSDETDWTLPVHGERRGIIHVGIEVRQDLIADEAGQARWAAILARTLPAALSSLDG